MPVRASLMARRTLEQSLQHMKDDYESKHYRNHADHGRVLLDQLWRVIGSFLDHRETDPLLFAYAVRDNRRAWTQLLNEVYAWSDAVLDADGPDVPDTGVR